MTAIKRKPCATQIIFGIYLLTLIWLVLFKLAFPFSDIQMLSGDRSVNFIPFYYDNNVGRFHLKEVILNVLVFVPFGMYLRMLSSSLKRTLLFGLIFSFTLELIQFIFAIGSCDITDIITNTSGTALGVCLYWLISKIFSKKATTDKIINIFAAVSLSLLYTLAILLFIAN